MSLINPLSEADTSHAIEIAPRIWWVGHIQEGHAFPYHVYLIEQGNDSLLIDPGSARTFRYTLGKIEEIIAFSKIRYFVCQHQGPDVAGALSVIDKLVVRPDACIIAHSSAQMLLQHYDVTLPFWLIDRNDWSLALSDRNLRFIFTPYAHFSGAFCSFDPTSGVLFSSDLFGSMGESFSLEAQDESYFDAMKSFHENYIPSNIVLQNALIQIKQYPIECIAPQRGSIIPKRLVEYMIMQLENLDCGIYMLLGSDSDIQRLSKLNQTLQDITKTMIVHRDFKDIVERLMDIIRRELPISTIEFYLLDSGGSPVVLNETSHYRSHKIEPDMLIKALLDKMSHQYEPGFWLLENPGKNGKHVCFHLAYDERTTTKVLACLYMPHETMIPEHLDKIIEQMTLPLQIAVERELLYEDMDAERQRIYERSIRDPLTQLYTRIYMKDMVQRVFNLHARDKVQTLAAVMLDLDHFKRINDTYGHSNGDVVLKEVSRTILDNSRKGDIPVRFGGEEIIVFIQCTSDNAAYLYGEKLRKLIAAITFEGSLAELNVTVSIGAAYRKNEEKLEAFIERIDKALYAAKSGGRNQVVVAD